MQQAPERQGQGEQEQEASEGRAQEAGKGKAEKSQVSPGTRGDIQYATEIRDWWTTKIAILEDDKNERAFIVKALKQEKIKDLEAKIANLKGEADDQGQ